MFAILALIAGVAAIVVGLMALVGGGIIASEAGADLAGVAVIGGIIILISGVCALLEGIFGIRAANDASKAIPYIVMAAIALVFAVIGLIMGGITNYSAISGALIDAFAVWFGIKVKNGE